MGSDSERLLSLWRRLGDSAPGRWLFSRLFGWMVPYTRTVRATVVELAPGRARLRMRDRRRVRNHLRSVHAMALANLAEAASGLALVTALSPDARAILTGFSIDYIKKARGPLEAIGAAAPGAGAEPRAALATAEIRDAAGDVVATARASWKIGPVKV